MNFFIVEIKAKYTDLEWLEAHLRERGARFIGKDKQEDTYFHVPTGRLKWRSGQVENSLIHYYRKDQPHAKVSEVEMVRVNHDSELKSMLTHALGVKVRVVKERQIFFVDNVKVHLDVVEELGTFVEIEAIDSDGTLGKEFLENQCQSLKEEFKITDDLLIDRSYSDLLLDKNA
ncbi:MAG: class IV adenylate cyclase [Bacteroidetes bacterium]|nr:class IV adenylate cyclase [Bacteroidota bacterium]